MYIVYRNNLLQHVNLQIYLNTLVLCAYNGAFDRSDSSKMTISLQSIYIIWIVNFKLIGSRNTRNYFN